MIWSGIIWYELVYPILLVKFDWDINVVLKELYDNNPIGVAKINGGIVEFEVSAKLYYMNFLYLYLNQFECIVVT